MNGVHGRTLRRFVELAADRLRGDWVLMGGGVLPLLGVEHRVTVDIDVAGPGDAAMDQTLVLMGIAEELGLPVEAINQAGAFFLRRVRGWERLLVEVHRGRNARILRPDATLFVLLKVDRMTESDLADCVEMLRLARGGGERVDRRRVLGAIDRLLAGGVPLPRLRRLEALSREVRGPR